MFLEAKPDGRIRLLIDLRFRNDNTVADHSQIPNQHTILQAVAKGKYRSKIDLSDAYFQTRVHTDDVKYNTIKTPFGGFTSQVMMQGDMNAPATFVRVMEDFISKNNSLRRGSSCTPSPLHGPGAYNVNFSSVCICPGTCPQGATMLYREATGAFRCTNPSNRTPREILFLLFAPNAPGRITTSFQCH